MTDTLDEIRQMNYEMAHGEITCLSGDPYCARNPMCPSGSYEEYSGSICGACEDAQEKAIPCDYCGARADEHVHELRKAGVRATSEWGFCPGEAAMIIDTLRENEWTHED